MHNMVGNIYDLELLTLFYFYCLILLLLFHLDIFWCPVSRKGPWSWVLFHYSCVYPNVWSRACIKWISSVLVGSDFSVVNVHSTDSFICHSLAIFYSQLSVWWCLFSCTLIWHHGLWGLNTEMYFFTVLEAGSLRSRCQPDLFFN